jgi:hypothetical protein
LLSDDGQRLFLLRAGQPGGPRRYPLCRLGVVPALYEQYPPEVRSVGPANPFEARAGLRYDNDKAAGRWEALNDLFGSVIVDAHHDLSAAWAAVSRLPPSDQRARLEEDLFRPPATEADLADYARRLAREGPRFRTEALNRWGEQARQHYRTVRRQAEP